ncbi:MAG: Maf family protein [Pseudanabaenaceae cyanobacterium]
MSRPFLVLASASTSRRRILQQAGINPIVWPSNFDEDQVKAEDADTLVTILAQGKAETVAPKFAGQAALVLGCDSVLELSSGIYGKPETIPNALKMWEQMRGGKGALVTGHCLIDVLHNRRVVRAKRSTVYFANATDREIEEYIHSREPLFCAGCFTLEGLGGWFIERIEGCSSNILGLSLPLLRQMLKELGYSLSFTSDRKAYLV